MKSIEEKHAQEMMRVKQKHKEKVRNLNKEKGSLEEQVKCLELRLMQANSEFEYKKKVMESEIQGLKEGKNEIESRFNETLESLQGSLNRKNEIIHKLKVEIEGIKKENAEEISRITEDTNRNIMELKAIYEKDKPRRSLDYGETYEKLKIEFMNLQQIIKTLENSEVNLKEQIKIKDDYIEKISRKLRMKASEDSKDSEARDLSRIKENLTEKLIDKEIEISKLKKTIGELKLEVTYGASKPPIHSPKTNRSMTFINKPDCPSPELSIFERQEEYNQLKKYERMFNQASAVECDMCYRNFQTSAFYEHILNCRFDESYSKSQSFFNSGSIEKLQELEKTVETLKLGLAKMKNQRDKAKIECEKLLMQLKQVKLEWALSEENYDEKLMDIKKQLKNTLEILIRIKRGVYLPDDLTFEIDLSIQNTDRFFGGRLSRSFISTINN